MANEIIQAKEIKFIRDSDEWGPVYEVICPECECKVRVSIGSTIKCDCDYKWMVTIKATGIK